jgi:hypothetical protein
VLLSLVVLLVAGTLKLWPLTATVATVSPAPALGRGRGRPLLFQWVPFDAAKGEEGVSCRRARC